MDDANGDLKAALEVAQMREQRGDIGGDVLVDPVQTDEGVEDEELWLEGLDGSAEAESVVLLVKTQGSGGDDVEWKASDGDGDSSAYTFEATTDDVESVLCGVDESVVLGAAQE